MWHGALAKEWKRFAIAASLAFVTSVAFLIWTKFRIGGDKPTIAVDDIVTLPDREIFDAMIWIMSHCKLVVEGAAAAPVAALLHGLIKAPAGSKVVVVLSGGNVNLDQLKGLKWN